MADVAAFTYIGTLLNARPYTRYPQIELRVLGKEGWQHVGSLVEFGGQNRADY